MNLSCSETDGGVLTGAEKREGSNQKMTKSISTRRLDQRPLLMVVVGRSRRRLASSLLLRRRRRWRWRRRQQQRLASSLAAKMAKQTPQAKTTGLAPCNFWMILRDSRLHTG